MGGVDNSMEPNLNAMRYLCFQGSVQPCSEKKVDLQPLLVAICVTL